MIRYSTVVLLWGLACCSSLTATESDEWKKLVQQTQESGKLPKDVVIRVSCSMFGGDTREGFRECWEFTSEHVHNVDHDGPGPVKSLPFDSAKILSKLSAGSLTRLSSDNDEGGFKMFALTDYELGDRFIEVMRDGEPLCSVGESCVGIGFRGTNAVAFAILYESIASSARVLFDEGTPPAAKSEKNEIGQFVKRMLNAPVRYDRNVARQLLVEKGKMDPDSVLLHLPHRRDNTEGDANVQLLRNEIEWQHFKHSAERMAEKDESLRMLVDAVFTDYIRDVYFHVQPADVYAKAHDDIPTRTVDRIFAVAAKRASGNSTESAEKVFALFLMVPHPRLREAAVKALEILGANEPVVVSGTIAATLTDNALGVRAAAAMAICRLHKLYSDQSSITAKAKPKLLHDLATKWWNSHHEEYRAQGKQAQ